MAVHVSRRALVGGAAALTSLTIVRRAAAAEFAFRQFHNQTSETTLHRALVSMWDSIRTETGGRVAATIHPENDGIAGGDPAALRMLIEGEIQFFTLMGGIIGTVVPVAEVQQMPFAFGSGAAAHRAVDGPLGAHIAQEMAANAMHLFPIAGFDNGMRQMAMVNRPVVRPEDLAGVKFRVPPGQIISDTIRAFGAEPVTTAANGIYSALRDGVVQAQENPLAVVEGFRLYELVKYVSTTNHIWSGFNQMAHLATWQRLPAEVRTVIERNVAASVRRQRVEQEALNARLAVTLRGRGLIFNEVDQRPFRARLGGLYASWKEKLGTRAWQLLEDAAGPLG
jgi:tripartite ATP-independent transporter DctP family solute receptor